MMRVNDIYLQPWVYNVLPWIISMITSVLFGMLTSFLIKKGWSKTIIRKGMNVSNPKCLSFITQVSNFSIT